MKVVALALAAVAVVGLHDSTAAAPRELLPDLRQEAPYKLAVQRATVAGRAQYQLIFASAVSNVGLSQYPVSIVGPGMFILAGAMFLGRVTPLAILWWTAHVTQGAGEMPIG